MRSALTTWLVIAAWLCLVQARLAAQDRAELEVDHDVRTRFVTPHTAWAKPYSLGKTRVLFFLRARDTEPREVCELLERFDFDAQMVFWNRIIDSTQEHWHGDQHGIERMADLLAQRWDAFVFLSPEPQGIRPVTPDMLPTEQQYELLRAVTEGAGLVLVGVDDRRVLKEPNRWAELPPILGDVDGAAAYKVLDGRAVRLPKRPTIGYRRGWEVDYDQWAMRVGKAILWAAGKEPKLNLDVRAIRDPTSRSELPGPAATLRWRGAPDGAAAELVLRRDDGAVVWRASRPLAAPEGDSRIDIPAAPAGRYVLDAIVRDDQAVAGFGSAWFDVASPQRIDEPTLEQDWAEIGQTLSGQVRWSHGSVTAADRADRLQISLYDRRGRELARTTHEIDPAQDAPNRADAAAANNSDGDAANDKAKDLDKDKDKDKDKAKGKDEDAAAGVMQHAFAFDIPAWYPMLLEVRATLSRGDAEIASSWRYARVVQRHRGRFNFVMWDTPHGTLAPWAGEALARSGVTIHLAQGAPRLAVAAYDMAWIPYTTHLGRGCDPVCWADDARIQSHVDAVVAKQAAARQHGVFAYSLGDEIAVRGSCTKPTCLAAYREYLRTQYGSIAALNASWDTRYASFDEVQLTRADDKDEADALQAGNFPRWFDRQAYQSDNFCKLCERFGDAFRRLDPHSRCGFEGAGTFGHGDDLDGFVRSNTFWSPYPGTADEVVRSIAPRDFPRANWMGYTKDADSLLEKYWRMVTRGCDAVWWWRWDALGRFHGWLAPSLDPFPAVADLLHDTQIVREGLGDLLLAATMQTDGVGILFSHASAYAARVETSPSFGTYEANHAAVHHALRELGLNFRYVTDRQLRLGEANLNEFKVVILPFTQALGETEAQRLREFVRGGGTLVADVRPAIYDGHVKPLASGSLDDVFGIRRTNRDKAATFDARVAISAADRESPPVELAQVRVDPGIEAAQAAAAGAAGQTPVFLTNRFGQGRAVLLNLALASFPSLAAKDTPEGAAVLMSNILNSGGVAPALRLVGSDGQRLRNVETTQWRNGATRIVSVFRHLGFAERVRLLLDKPQYVYDLKAHRELGRCDALDVDVTPCRASFYVLADEPLRPVTLRAAPTVARGGVQRIAIQPAMRPGHTAVKLEVRLPDGRMADWADTVLTADAQGAVADVSVAYNDPAGTWTVTATELCTHAATSVTFVVE